MIDGMRDLDLRDWVIGRVLALISMGIILLIILGVLIFGGLS